MAIAFDVNKAASRAWQYCGQESLDMVKDKEKKAKILLKVANGKPLTECSKGQCVGVIKRVLAHIGIQIPGMLSCSNQTKYKALFNSHPEYYKRVDNSCLNSPRYGDIALYSGGATVGHGCIYVPIKGRGRWVSDFVLNSWNVYRNAKNKAHDILAFRYVGSVNGDGAKVSFPEATATDGEFLLDSSLAGGLYSSVDSEARQKLQELYLKVLQQNAYPVHSDYLTFSSEYGNLFKASENDAITRAAFVNSSILNENDKLYRENKTNIQGRIYSTNDTLLVLDELSLPSDYKNDVYVSSNIKDSERKLKQSNYDIISDAKYLPGNQQPKEVKSEENKENTENKENKK